MCADSLFPPGGGDARTVDDVTSLVPFWRSQRVLEEQRRLSRYESELAVCQPDGPFAESMRKMIALQRDVLAVVKRHANGETAHV